MRISAFMVACILVPVVAAGCSGPNAGDTYSVTSAGSLYLDEKLFTEACELKAAGTSMGFADDWKALGDGRLMLLNNGAVVRVIQRAKGGAKVAVVGGGDAGKIGWMLADDLRDSSKR